MARLDGKKGEKNQLMEKLTSTQIAAKRRHLFLLQKVKANKALSTAEVRELEKYEKNSNVEHPTLNVERPMTLSESSLKQLAMEGKTIAEAEHLISEYRTQNIERRRRIGKKKNSKTLHSSHSTLNLNQIFEKRPELKTAFDRGRFLHNRALS